MKNSGYDLSRCVRGERYKLIYNCTPWIPYAPVDSAGGPGWKEMTAAHAAGTLTPPLSATYFTTPRPVYELYDLSEDPAKLHNLGGQAAVVDVETELRLALAEKMITDFDYLPLPAIPGTPNRRQAAQGRGAAGNRSAQFERKGVDTDGRLSLEEYQQWFRSRRCEEAVRAPRR